MLIDFDQMFKTIVAYRASLCMGHEAQVGSDRRW